MPPSVPPTGPKCKYQAIYYILSLRSFFILQFFGHVARKDCHNLGKLMVTGKMIANDIRWSDQIRKSLDTKPHKAE